MHTAWAAPETLVAARTDEALKVLAWPPWLLSL